MALEVATSTILNHCSCGVTCEIVKDLGERETFYFSNGLSGLTFFSREIDSHRGHMHKKVIQAHSSEPRAEYLIH